MKLLQRTLFGVLGLAAVLSFSPAPALALDPYDPVVLSCVDGAAGRFSITLQVCAGATGAPAGISIQWMKYEDYVANGNSWNNDLDCALSLSGQPSLQHPGKSRWELTPGECEEVAIGDHNFDETGVSGDPCSVEPLECGTTYIFRSFAHAGRRMGRSDWSYVVCATLPCQPGGGCTFTQGYWKTHGPGDCHKGNNANAWPVSSMTLGNVSYTALQLCAIFETPAGNGQSANGLISMAHQLIAAKLNLANGAASCDAVYAAITAADALIGSLVVPPVGTGYLAPGSTSALNNQLTDFNEGRLSGCPGHCDNGSNLLFEPAPATKTNWGGLKVRYR